MVITRREVQIYEHTVELLRDLSCNHAAAAAQMARPLSARGTGSRAVGAPALEDLAVMLRRLEDVGVDAVCRLARAGEDSDAYAAIEEAGAGWLREVILNRAGETVAPPLAHER